MRKGNPRSISEIINSLLKNLGVEQKVKENLAIVYWNEVVGEYIAGVSEAESVENGVLYVKVSNPAWKHQLFMMRRDIINRLNAKLKYEAIKEIVFIDVGEKINKNKNF
jgi:predicted nucleic acid-binding Zn ribbon protein